MTSLAPLHPAAAATAPLDPLADRTLTELDQVRLEHLIRRRAAAGDDVAAPLEALLDTADVVPSRSVAADIVTMNSQVRVVDAVTGEPQHLTVCWPADAQAAAGRVSVLSPLGAGLLGHRAGSVARWCAPDGAPHAVTVEAVLFQPEASGDYTA